MRGVCSTCTPRSLWQDDFVLRPPDFDGELLLPDDTDQNGVEIEPLLLERPDLEARFRDLRLDILGQPIGKIRDTFDAIELAAVVGISLQLILVPDGRAAPASEQERA